MINNIKWIVKSVINHYLIGFSIYSILFLSKRNNIVNKNTDLLIDGYPRSGNTFCYTKFKLLNPKLNIASHRHEFGHIDYALQSKVPVVVVIRDPIDSISSFVIREKVSIYFAIRYYISFYNKVFSRIDNIILLSFKSIILNQDLGFIHKKDIVFRKINKEEELVVKEMIFMMEKSDSGKSDVRYTHLAYPNKETKEDKKDIRDIICKKYPNLLEKSEYIYNKLLVYAHTAST